mmetsp:Transcript_11223/g.31402  ORF Transcript_11223/g.31402 Transcript_11223/m.31402 type:complete len:312 (-) Transcript_11223:480-1415(-)
MRIRDKGQNRGNQRVTIRSSFSGVRRPQVFVQIQFSSSARLNGHYGRSSPIFGTLEGEGGRTGPPDPGQAAGVPVSVTVPASSPTLTSLFSCSILSYSLPIASTTSFCIFCSSSSDGIQESIGRSARISSGSRASSNGGASPRASRSMKACIGSALNIADCGIGYAAARALAARSAVSARARSAASSTRTPWWAASNAPSRSRSTSFSSRSLETIFDISSDSFREASRSPASGSAESLSRSLRSRSSFSSSPSSSTPRTLTLLVRSLFSFSLRANWRSISLHCEPRSSRSLSWAFSRSCDCSANRDASLSL